MPLDDRVVEDREKIREKESELFKLRTSDMIPGYGLLEYSIRTQFGDMEFYGFLPAFNTMLLFAYNSALGGAFFKYLENSHLL